MDTKTLIQYRMIDDVPENERGFNLIGRKKINPSLQVVKENFIKGEYGYKDLYIRHLVDDEVFIVSYTHAELSSSQRNEIIEQAKQWLSSQN